MKTLSTILGTLAALLILALLGRYLTSIWLFYTPASFQIQGAAGAFVIAALAFLFHRSVVNIGLMAIAAGIGIHGYQMLHDFRQPALQEYGDTPTFKLLSINIMGDNTANGGKIADYIIGSGADVVFIQESAPIGPQIDRMKVVYPYRLGCGAKTITCDSSLWSKTQLVTGDVYTASPIYRDRLMIASIEFGGKLINFANVHLTKPYFDTMHAVELKKISERLDQLKGPLVLAGDFNGSILMPDVRGFLTHNKLMTYEWEPHTWPVDYPAIGAAIDHVFVTDPLRINALTQVPDPIGSNHFGLMAEVFLIDPTATYEDRK
jgi:endonuclease/exonuclease/phosphatase (EEP) superfamily protein YafD